MDYKILEANGIDNENVDGAAFNNFAASGQDTILPGVLNECKMVTVNSTTIQIDTGELLIQGFRIKILSPYQIKQTSTITPTQFDIIARITLRSDRSVLFQIVCQAPKALSKDPLFKYEQGVYEAKLGHFIMGASGIDSVVRTIPILDTEDFQKIFLRKSEISQEPGDSTEKVMSQKAVTDTVKNYPNIADFYTWVNKSMDADGNIVSDTTGGLRIITEDLIDMSKNDFWEVQAKNNCKFSVVYYDVSGNFLYNTPRITKHIVNHNGKCRFFVFGNTEILSPTNADKYITICHIENIASGDDLLNPCDLPATKSDELTVEVDNGFIKADGAGGAQVRLSNRSAVARNYGDLADIVGVNIFEHGKKYNLLVELISGSGPSNNVNGIILIDTNGSIVTTSARSTYTHDINKPVSAIVFGLTYGVYENAVYSVAIVEADENEEKISPQLTSRYFDTSPTRNKEFAEYLKYITYPTINKIHPTSVYNQSNINSDGHYKSFQGFASDHKRYLFNAVYWSDITLNSTLQKFDLETGELVLSVTDHCYGKPHDMTYCPLDNMIYIIDSQSYTDCRVYVVDADTLQYVREFTLGAELVEKINGFQGMASLDYNVKRQKFIFQERQYHNQIFAIYDKDFNFEKLLRIDAPKLENLPYQAMQGMSTDDNFIYTTYYGITADNVTINYIYAWDWHGNFVYSVPVQYNGGEVEGMSKVGNEIYMNLNGTYDFIKGIPVDTGYRYKVDVLSQYNLNI